MKVDGSCHCGKIAFEAEADPARVRLCHCTDCQSLSGSGFRVVLPVPEANFVLLRGEPKVYVKTAASGALRVQAFCGECGSPLYATSPDGENRSFGIRVGTLRQRAQLAPSREFWSQSRLPWLPPLTADPIDGQ